MKFYTTVSLLLFSVLFAFAATNKNLGPKRTGMAPNGGVTKPLDDATRARAQVMTKCTSRELDRLYLPGIKSDADVSTARARVCNTMSSLFVFMGMAEKATREATAMDPSKTKVTMGCWKAVAQHWKHTKNDLATTDAAKIARIDFLSGELAAVLDLESINSDEANRNTSELCKPVSISLDDKLKGHVQSCKNVIAAGIEKLNCTNEEMQDEQNRWAQAVLERDFPLDMFPCRTKDADRTSPFQRLQNCKTQRSKIIGLLNDRFRDPKGSQGWDPLDGCLDAVTVASGGGSERWAELQAKCSTANISLATANYNSAVRGHETETLARIRGATSGCGAIRGACTEMVLGALETGQKTRCPIQPGFGKMSGGTCFFHALSAATYSSGAGCPGREGPNVSIGTLQQASGITDTWEVERGAGAAEIEKLQKSFPVPGMKLNSSSEPISANVSASRLPMIVSVMVNDPKTSAGADLGLTEALVRNSDQFGEESGGHALLITQIINKYDSKGKVIATLAVVRDANFSYKGALIPIEQLVAASKYYTNEVYKGKEKDLAPPTAYVTQK